MRKDYLRWLLLVVLCADGCATPLEGSTVVVSLGESRPQDLATRDYALPRTGSVRIAQMPGAYHRQTGWTQWDAGFCLADYIERTSLWDMRCDPSGCDVRSRYANATVLELGAGSGGLVAIALANAGARVLATDGDEDVLDILDANVRANSKGHTGFLGSALLRWGDPADLVSARNRLGTNSHLDLIVAADVAFRTADARALLEVFEALSRDPRGPPEILLAHTYRFSRDDRDFFHAVDAVFVRTEVPKADLYPDCHAGRFTSIFRLVVR